MQNTMKLRWKQGVYRDLYKDFTRIMILDLDSLSTFGMGYLKWTS